jgi:hypothetical protein
MQSSVPRNLVLDYAVGICSVWIASGFFLDAWAHGHVPVEGFFTPYHAVFYSGMVAIAVVFAVFVARGRRLGHGWRESLPTGYRLAVLGIPIFFLAGFADMLWHLLIGLEEGVDAILSPTHLALGMAMFFMAAGPIRSVLADRANSTTFARQFPLVLGLATWLILIHFATAFAFDPAAGRIDAPPAIGQFSPDYLTSIAIGYYKVSTGVLILIFQALVMAAFALWAAARIRLRPGSFVAFFLIGNIPPAATFGNGGPMLAVTIVQALVAGTVADLLMARLDPQTERPAVFRIFGILVALGYSGTYLISMVVAERLWWDWNISLGSWILCGVVGAGLGVLGTARRTQA